MGFFLKLFGSGQSETIDRVKDKLAFLEVDIHNHLLPGIDDGSHSVEQSLGLIKGLNVLGLEKFICTPHIMAEVYPNTKLTIAAAYEQLRMGLENVGSNVQIIPAAEHMIDEGLEVLVKKNDLSVIPGGYVLIEMSYLQEARSLFRTISDMQQLGYKPILAHPERYSYYHQKPDMYTKIKDTGCLLQLNLLAIARYYGPDVKVAALNMIKSGMYDFVGTDTHHEKHLAALYEIATKYPVRELLKNCTILNPTLLDHFSKDTAIKAGA